MSLKLVLMLSVLVVGALVAFVWLQAHKHERQAEAEFPPLGQFLQIDGHQVHAMIMGDGPDLVLLHGSGGNLRDFTLDIAPKLATSYRVIMFDRPGHGYTDRVTDTGTTIKEQAHLLAEAARQLGAEKPIVLGHSFGGSVALAWAAHEPESIAALIPLAAPSNPWSSDLPFFYKVTSHPFIAPIVNPVIAGLVPETRVETGVASVFSPNAVPAGYLDHFGAGLTLRRDSLRANALQRRNLLGEIKALVPFYSKIDVPTEIVHGEIDLTVGLSIHSELLVDQIKGATLTRLKDVAHMPHHAAPDEVISAVHRVAYRAGLRPAP